MRCGRAAVSAVVSWRSVMTRTGWTLVVAGLLATSCVSIGVLRRYSLGEEVDGPRRAGTWRVILNAHGTLGDHDSSLTLSLAPDFRNQHVFDEQFSSKELIPRAAKDKGGGRPDVVFHRAGKGRVEVFQASASFRVHTGLRSPTPAMELLTGELDAAPVAGGPYLRPSARIESENESIRRQAAELAQRNDVDERSERMDLVRSFYDYVADLPRKRLTEPRSASQCLQAEGGEGLGKSRLLVAFCRNRGVPARVVTGLVLTAGEDLVPHYWAEAWVNDLWLPMDPTNHHFGSQKLPRRYLVLQIGDEPLTRGKAKVQLSFAVRDLRRADVEETPSPSREFWQRLSLHELGPRDRRLLRFLLLLPLSALVVSVFRTVIGVPTYGTFSPALLGLAFLDLKALHWGLAIFVLIVLAGWLMRRLLEGFHLLQVPRTSAMLTLIVLLLLVVVVVASHYGVPATHFIRLFPLVILTHLVERFWTVEAEDGTASSFKTLAGTMLVAATITLSLAPTSVGRWMLTYPESLGVVLAAQLALGRYTAYRLTELYRFGDLLETGTGGQDRGSGVEGLRVQGAKESQADTNGSSFPQPSAPLPLTPEGGRR